MTKGKKRKTTAPGQAYGYFVQVVRVLWHLLRASRGDVVAFETLGDVTVESGQSIVSEEDKSGLAHNPIADNSPALWKTFANWADARRDGLLPPGCKYILYVAQPHEGCLVQQLSDCDSLTHAEELIAELRAQLTSSKRSSRKDGRVGETLQAQLDRVFAHSNSLIASIVVDFTLEKAVSSAIDEVVAEISHSASDEHVDSITENLLGWVKRQLMTHIKNGTPARICYDDFRKQRLAISKRVSGSLTAFPEYDLVPTRAEISRQLVDRVYVRQLELLDMGSEDIEQQITDYLWASAQRTEWSESGYLDKTSFQRYQEELVSRWRLCRMSVESSHAEKAPIARGIQVLFNCLGEEVRIQSIPVPQSFLRGSFHAIADEPRIGWHPDWKKLLGVDGKGGN